MLHLVVSNRTLKKRSIKDTKHWFQNVMAVPHLLYGSERRFRSMTDMSRIQAAADFKNRRM
jgi:hypothetical protein